MLGLEANLKRKIEMSNTILAIANYRVSSTEQLKNNSLTRQEISVKRAAKELGAQIVETWSGSVSSKAGTNIRRKDLLEMLEYCKKDKRIKYAIFDEYDRFMRSVNEGPYFEVLFQMTGVKVWYASESQTFNGDDAMAKFMRTMSAFKAEGSNEERIRKSISGQTVALNAGKYPFSPKPGYMRGTTAAIPEIHPVRGPALRDVLVRISNHSITPSEGLKELNNSSYTLERSPMKMDKFRRIATDPFNAGIVEIRKQVNVRNPAGIHDPLISMEQYEEINKIFNAKAKNQSGPRKNGNPDYPLNNLVSHDTCLIIKNKGKFVGFNHSNGKNKQLLYQKYRCRSCGFYISRAELHSKVEELFETNRLAPEAIKDLVEALEIVWKKKEAQSLQDSARLSQKLNGLVVTIRNQALEAIDPANSSIKTELLENIQRMKAEMSEIEEEISILSERSDTDKERFITFALEFAGKMGNNFLSIDAVSRDKCKQIIFPAGFYIDSNKNVYTPEMSTLIRLATKKRDTEVSQKSHLVRVQGL